jgi:hypothetical protein
MRDAVDYVVNVLTIPLADALMMATLTRRDCSASMPGSGS